MKTETAKESSMQRHTICIVDIDQQFDSHLLNQIDLGGMTCSAYVSNISDLISTLKDKSDAIILMISPSSTVQQDFERLRKITPDSHISLICDQISDDDMNYFIEARIDGIYSTNFLTVNGLTFLIKKLEQQIYQSQKVIEKNQFIAHILEDMEEAVVCFDEKGGVIALNPAGKKLFGPYLRFPFHNEPNGAVLWYENDGSTMIEPSKLPITSALAGKNVFQKKFCLSFADGSEDAWISVTCRLHRLDKNTNGCILVARDHSQEKSSEFQLQREVEENHMRKTQLNAILDSVADGIVCCDNYGQILYANRQSKEYLGDNLSNIVLHPQPKDKAVLFASDGQTKLLDGELPLVKVLQGKAFEKQIFLIKHLERKKDVWVSVSGKPIMDQNSTVGGVIAIHDITSEKLDAIEKELLLADFQKANRELKITDDRRQRLLRILAHDLRNPLAGMGMLLETLIEDEEGDFDRQSIIRILSMMEGNIEALVEMVDGIVREAMDQGTKEKVIARDVVARAIKNTSSQAHAKGIIVESQVEGILPKLYVDKTICIIVVENLISNAIKFSDKGGRIDVSIKNDSPNGVSIVVKDYGIGIPEHIKSKIFSGDSEICREGTNKEVSTGIGLHFVADVVKKMNGRISVDSIEGSYTSFLVTFPTSKNKQQVA